MCLLIMVSRVVPEEPLVVGANRDERFDRPAVAMTVLQDAEPRILGGRDERAGGTWLAVNEHGVVAGLTNTPSSEGRDPTRRSRGVLPLLAAREASAARGAEALASSVRPSDFNRAWMLVGDRSTLFAVTIAGARPAVEELGPGVYVVENRPPGDQSVKVRHVEALLGRDRFTLGAPALRTRIAEVLGDHRSPPDALVAADGRAAHVLAACVHGEEYGTRSSAVIGVPADAARRPIVAVADGPPCRTAFADRSELWSSRVCDCPNGQRPVWLDLEGGAEVTACNVRPMTRADLAAAAAVTNAAFGVLFGMPEGATLGGDPIFGSLFFEVRFAADPAGCFVAEAADDPGRLVGVLISVARGTLGWFGPLAVDPGAQKSGVGESLVRACLARWDERGVRLRGLETFGDSAFHVRFYGGLGFRPSWTGLNFERRFAEEVRMPDGVEIDGNSPPLDFLYPGVDVSGEIAATAACSAGHVLATEDGVCILHLARTFQSADTGYVPFLAAANQDSFERLLQCAEHLSAAHGKTGLYTRTSGSSWRTTDALVARGYRAGQAMIRMKAGDDLDYDGGEAFYLDNWL